MTNYQFNPSPELPSRESFQAIPDARARVHAGVGRLKWAIYQQYPENFVAASKEVRDHTAQAAAKLVSAAQQEKQFANDVENFAKSVAEDPAMQTMRDEARRAIDGELGARQ